MLQSQWQTGGSRDLAQNMPITQRQKLSLGGIHPRVPLAPSLSLYHCRVRCKGQSGNGCSRKHPLSGSPGSPQEKWPLWKKNIDLISCSSISKHLYNVGPTSKTLDRRCTNVIQMFCVCWGNSVAAPPVRVKTRNCHSLKWSILAFHPGGRGAILIHYLSGPVTSVCWSRIWRKKQAFYYDTRGGIFEMVVSATLVGPHTWL